MITISSLLIPSGNRKLGLHVGLEFKGFTIISRLAYEDKFKSLEFLRISGNRSTFDLDVPDVLMNKHFTAWNS